MKSKHYKTAFLFLLIGLSMSYAKQPNYPTIAADAQLIYTDLENFTNALKHLEERKDTIQVLNTYYFNKASIGLKEYINRHGLTAEMLKDAIKKNPQQYQKFENFISGLNEFKNKLTNVFHQFERVVPNTMFAPTYLLVGANRGIAQASQQGQLVTITKVLEEEGKLLKLIVHELAHFQQAKNIGGQQYVALYSQSDNMLGICLREGGAEFITEQVLGGFTQEKAIPYFMANEKDLKQKFIEDLKTQNKTFWLWDSIGKKEYPQLLGYVMGYKIWSNYLKETENRDLVIKEILNLTEAEKYIEKSKYY